MEKQSLAEEIEISESPDIRSKKRITRLKKTHYRNPSIDVQMNHGLTKSGTQQEGLPFTVKSLNEQLVPDSRSRSKENKKEMKSRNFTPK